MTDATTRLNPFPGLRSFGSEDATFFFGRDQEVNELLDRLQERRVVLVAGQSGSGRTSVVRAGLLPALEPSEWRVSCLRPGFDPVRNLAQAFSSSISSGDPKLVERELHASSFGLTNPAFRDHTPHLFVVDQLEEIFRFGARSPVNDAQIAEFLNLLFTAAARPTPPTYVLFVVRAEFLGDCAYWLRLTEAMNAGALYFLPRLKRDRLREAITAPIRVAGAEIAPSLVQRVLNDAGDDPHALPSLQYTLRRTWEAWARSEEPRAPIDHRDYDTAGGMNGSLDQGANEALQALSEEQRRLAPPLFQALMSVSGEQTIRRPATVRELAAITGATVAELTGVISYFAAPERALLSTAFDSATPETIVDIGHEDLLHRWTALREWAAKERESARILTQMDRLREYGATLSGLQIQEASDWLARERPTEAWAAKYGFSVAAVTQFVAAQTRATRLRRNRIILLGTLLLAIVLAALFTLVVYLR